MIDRYTKVVLTVIAGALVVIATHDFVYPARAQLKQDGPQKVQVCDDLGHCAAMAEMTGTGFWALSTFRAK